MPRVTDNDIIQAVKRNRGRLAFAAHTLNITEAAIRRRAAKSKRVATAIREAERLLDDIAAQKLFESVEAGATSAISIYLRARQTERAAEVEGLLDKTQLVFHKKYYDNNAHDHPAATAAAPVADSVEPGPV